MQCEYITTAQLAKLIPTGPSLRATIATCTDRSWAALLEDFNNNRMNLLILGSDCIV